MAISSGQKSSEGNFIRYVGVASCFVKAVNPTKKEMENLYGRTIEKDVDYVGTATVDDKEIKTARISFIVQPDPEKYDINTLFTHTYFIRREYRYNRDKTKVQVIDKYGRTCWVTVEQAKKHEIPMYSNGPANIDKDYRPCYVGEEELTQFIIKYLNIPNPMKYDRENNKWYMVDNPQECECRLDEVEKYFKGDFTEIRSAIALQPENKVKILFTVRNSDDNKQYQGSYTRMVLNNAVKDYSKLDKDIQEMKNNSNSANIASTVYDVTDFHEYKIEPTTFTENTATEVDPFATSDLPDELDALPFD